MADRHDYCPYCSHRVDFGSLGASIIREPSENKSIHDPNLTKEMLDKDPDVIMDYRRKHFKRKMEENSSQNNKRAKQKLNHS